MVRSATLTERGYWSVTWHAASTKQGYWVVTWCAGVDEEGGMDSDVAHLVERGSGGRIVDPPWLGPKRAVTTGFEDDGGGG